MPSNNLKGPDLTRGIFLAVLRDGEPFLGHVDDTQVILVKRGDEVFAVGATCPHYGGPLQRGLVRDNTLRCPLHHATFNLRSGEALTPPALAPLPCYVVDRLPDSVVAVRSKRTNETMVIVGGGAAAHVAAETLRREGFTGRVVMISADPAPPCDRPNLSKEYLAGRAPEDWLFLRPRAFYEEHRVELVLGTRVTGIDLAKREVTTDRGTTYAYGALLLATGADVVRLDIPGADLPHVHYLRTVGDAQRLVAAAKGARKVAVIGASFIGLEVAASLRELGLAVSIAAPEERPLARIMGPEMGDLVRAIHTRHGVDFHLGRRATAIAPEHVTLDDGTTLEADLVVVGVGVRPNLELATTAGLAIDRGIVVDRYLRTSAPNIYAAGDVARWPDPRSGERIRVEHWVVAERHGQIAARNMLGRQEACTFVPFFWSRHYDRAIGYVGHAEKWDDIVIEGSLDPSAPDCRLEYRREGKLLAVATIGRHLENLRAEARMEAEATALSEGT